MDLHLAFRGDAKFALDPLFVMTKQRKFMSFSSIVSFIDLQSFSVDTDIGRLIDDL